MNRTGTAALAALAVAALAALAAVLLDRQGSGRTAWPERFESNGERLYFTGRSERGTRMLPSGGEPHAMMMRRGACVACHGADRQGGRLAMRFWQAVPPLTPEALAGEHDGEDDGHAHAAYTAASLARAITDGVGPEGEPLDAAMPRWSMSEADLADVVAYLMDDPSEEP